MSADVVPLRPGYVGDQFRIEPDEVLRAAEDKMATVVVLGLDRNGELYLASSDGAERAYFLMERAKLWLLDHQTVRS
jgi:hypothetical protein